jgi:hypothetical protein
LGNRPRNSALLFCFLWPMLTESCHRAGGILYRSAISALTDFSLLPSFYVQRCI